jgi:hypothetical protein
MGSGSLTRGKGLGFVQLLGSVSAVPLSSQIGGNEGTHRKEGREEVQTYESRRDVRLRQAIVDQERSTHSEPDENRRVGDKAPTFCT